MPDLSQEPEITPAIDVEQSPIVAQPINGQSSGLEPRKKNVKKLLLIIAALVIGLGVILSSIALIWYNTQLAPLGTDKQQLILVTVEKGTTPQQIGKLLESKAIIRSSAAFDIYTRLVGKRDVLQAGTYRLSPASSTPELVEHLVKGDVDEFSITFLPGATLAEHRKVFLDAGFSATEVDDALKGSYDSPIFAGKPTSADLEGYIYGETYKFNSGATVGDILKRTFAEFESVINENGLVEGFASHGLNLYQGITLASVIQREASSSADRNQIAQVFYSRLASGMMLGSDVTYQYIADKLKVPRDTNLDSPYNTRRYPGLPYGPIASPGLTALLAVKSPASGDYLFFLSGDDDKTYFARTNAEHEANIRNYCTVKCSTL